jgi:hypothetical protein
MSSLLFALSDVSSQLHYGVEGDFLEVAERRSHGFQVLCARGVLVGKQDDVTGLAPDEMWGDSTITLALLPSSWGCAAWSSLLMPRWAN